MPRDPDLDGPGPASGLSFNSFARNASLRVEEDWQQELLQELEEANFSDADGDDGYEDGADGDEEVAAAEGQGQEQETEELTFGQLPLGFYMKARNDESGAIIEAMSYRNAGVRAKELGLAPGRPILSINGTDVSAMLFKEIHGNLKNWAKNMPMKIVFGAREPYSVTFEHTHETFGLELEAGKDGMGVVIARVMLDVTPQTEKDVGRWAHDRGIEKGMLLTAVDNSSLRTLSFDQAMGIITAKDAVWPRVVEVAPAGYISMIGKPHQQPVEEPEPAKSSADAERDYEGSPVEVFHLKTKSWKRATVVKKRPSGSWDIQWPDGRIVKMKCAKNVRFLSKTKAEPEVDDDGVGSRVSVYHLKSKSWKPATVIKKRKSGAYDVVWDHDGSVVKFKGKKNVRLLFERVDSEEKKGEEKSNASECTMAGERVYVYKMSEKKWEAATVIQVRASGSYDIRWDDGRVAKCKPAKSVRKMRQDDGTISVEISSLPLGFCVDPETAGLGLKVKAVSQQPAGQKILLCGVDTGAVLKRIGAIEISGMPYQEAVDLLSNAATPYTITFQAPAGDAEDDGGENYSVDDRIAVYSVSDEVWFEDGVVNRVDKKGINVQYNHGQVMKWVEADWFDELLRAPMDDQWEVTSVMFTRRPFGFDFEPAPSANEVAVVTDVSEQLHKVSGLRPNFSIRKIGKDDVQDLPGAQQDGDYYSALSQILENGRLPIKILFQELPDEEDEKYQDEEYEEEAEPTEEELEQKKQEEKKKQQMEAIFQTVDLDSNGVIDMDEFLQLTRHTFKWSDQVAKQTFDEIDTDGNGTLDFDEFVQAISMGTFDEDAEHPDSGFDKMVSLTGLANFNLHDDSRHRQMAEDLHKTTEALLNDEDYSADEGEATCFDGLMKQMSLRVGMDLMGDLGGIGVAEEAKRNVKIVFTQKPAIQFIPGSTGNGVVVRTVGDYGKKWGVKPGMLIVSVNGNNVEKQPFADAKCWLDSAISRASILQQAVEVVFREQTLEEKEAHAGGDELDDLLGDLGFDTTHASDADEYEDNPDDEKEYEAKDDSEYHVGDVVKAGETVGEAKQGVVTSVEPLMVKLSGWDTAYEWKYVEPKMHNQGSWATTTAQNRMIADLHAHSGILTGVNTMRATSADEFMLDRSGARTTGASLKGAGARAALKNDMDGADSGPSVLNFNRKPAERAALITDMLIMIYQTLDENHNGMALKELANGFKSPVIGALLKSKGLRNDITLFRRFQEMNTDDRDDKLTQEEWLAFMGVGQPEKFTRDDLVAIYQKLDANGDGMSLAELAKGLEDPAIKQILGRRGLKNDMTLFRRFEEINTGDNDDRLTQKDWLEFMRPPGAKWSVEGTASDYELRLIFKKLDRNNDGVLSLKELGEGFKSDDIKAVLHARGIMNDISLFRKFDEMNSDDSDNVLTIIEFVNYMLDNQVDEMRATVDGVQSQSDSPLPAPDKGVALNPPITRTNTEENWGPEFDRQYPDANPERGRPQTNLPPGIDDEYGSNDELDLLSEGSEEVRLWPTTPAKHGPQQICAWQVGDIAEGEVRSGAWVLGQVSEIYTNCYTEEITVYFKWPLGYAENRSNLRLTQIRDADYSLPKAAAGRKRSTSSLTANTVIDSWSEHDVSSWIKGLGGGQVWGDYSKLFLEQNIDGVTLLQLDIQDLDDIGVRKYHAKTILAKTEQINQLPYPNTGLSPTQI